jgi:hypothetical protein
MAAGSNSNALLLLIWKEAPFTIPDPYRLLATFVPGVDSVRVVYRLSAGVILTLSILAGLGAAGIIRSFGRHAEMAAAGFIALAAISVMRPDAFGAPQPRGWDVHEVHADQESVRFFAALARLGNDGPLLELPYDPYSLIPADRIFLISFHHRRTSTCYASFQPPVAKEIAALSARLPDPEAVLRLRALGFTTVIVHHELDPADSLGTRLRDTEENRKSLRLLRANRSLTAFELGGIDGPRDPQN